MMTVTIFTGMAYLAAAAVAMPGVRLLGRTYATQITAPWPILGFGLFYMIVLFWRGVTLLFPGELVTVQNISLVAPTLALTTLALNLILLDQIMRMRAPPPLLERLMGGVFRVAIREGVSDATLDKMAMASPAMPFGPSASEAGALECSRPKRIAMLVLAGLIISGIAAIILLASSAGT